MLKTQANSLLTLFCVHSMLVFISSRERGLKHPSVPDEGDCCSSHYIVVLFFTEDEGYKSSAVIKRRYFCCFAEHFKTVAPIAKLYNRNKSTVFLLRLASSKVLFYFSVENVEFGWRSYFALMPHIYFVITIIIITIMKKTEVMMPGHPNNCCFGTNLNFNEEVYL